LSTLEDALADPAPIFDSALARSNGATGFPVPAGSDVLTSVLSRLLVRDKAILGKLARDEGLDAQLLASLMRQTTRAWYRRRQYLAGLVDALTDTVEWDIADANAFRSMRAAEERAAREEDEAVLGVAPSDAAAAAAATTKPVEPEPEPKPEARATAATDRLAGSKRKTPAEPEAAEKAVPEESKGSVDKPADKTEASVQEPAAAASSAVLRSGSGGANGTNGAANSSGNNTSSGTVVIGGRVRRQAAANAEKSISAQVRGAVIVNTSAEDRKPPASGRSSSRAAASKAVDYRDPRSSDESTDADGGSGGSGDEAGRADGARRSKRRRVEGPAAAASPAAAATGSGSSQSRKQRQAATEEDQLLGALGPRAKASLRHIQRDRKRRTEAQAAGAAEGAESSDGADSAEEDEEDADLAARTGKSALARDLSDSDRALVRGLEGPFEHGAQVPTHAFAEVGPGGALPPPLLYTDTVVGLAALHNAEKKRTLLLREQQQRTTQASEAAAGGATAADPDLDDADADLPLAPAASAAASAHPHGARGSALSLVFQGALEASMPEAFPHCFPPAFVVPPLGAGAATGTGTGAAPLHSDVSTAFSAIRPFVATDEEAVAVATELASAGVLQPSAVPLKYDPEDYWDDRMLSKIRLRAVKKALREMKEKKAAPDAVAASEPSAPGDAAADDAVDEEAEEGGASAAEGTGDKPLPRKRRKELHDLQATVVRMQHPAVGDAEAAAIMEAAGGGPPSSKAAKGLKIGPRAWARWSGAVPGTVSVFEATKETGNELSHDGSMASMVQKQLRDQALQQAAKEAELALAKGMASSTRRQKDSDEPVGGAPSLDDLSKAVTPEERWVLAQTSIGSLAVAPHEVAMALMGEVKTEADEHDVAELFWWDHVLARIGPTDPLAHTEWHMLPLRARMLLLQALIEVRMTCPGDDIAEFVAYSTGSQGISASIALQEWSPGKGPLDPDSLRLTMLGDDSQGSTYWALPFAFYNGDTRIYCETKTARRGTSGASSKATSWRVVASDTASIQALVSEKMKNRSGSKDRLLAESLRAFADSIAEDFERAQAKAEKEAKKEQKEAARLVATVNRRTSVRQQVAFISAATASGDGGVGDDERMDGSDAEGAEGGLGGLAMGALALMHRSFSGPVSYGLGKGMVNIGSLDRDRIISLLDRMTQTDRNKAIADLLCSTPECERFVGLPTSVNPARRFTPLSIEYFTLRYQEQIDRERRRILKRSKDSERLAKAKAQLMGGDEISAAAQAAAKAAAEFDREIRAIARTGKITIRVARMPADFASAHYQGEETLNFSRDIHPAIPALLADNGMESEWKTLVSETAEATETALVADTMDMEESADDAAAATSPPSPGPEAVPASPAPALAPSAESESSASPAAGGSSPAAPSRVKCGPLIAFPRGSSAFDIFLTESRFVADAAVAFRSQQTEERIERRYQREREAEERRKEHRKLRDAALRAAKRQSVVADGSAALSAETEIKQETGISSAPAAAVLNKPRKPVGRPKKLQHGEKPVPAAYAELNAAMSAAAVNHVKTLMGMSTMPQLPMMPMYPGAQRRPDAPATAPANMQSFQMFQYLPPGMQMQYAMQAQAQLHAMQMMNQAAQSLQQKQAAAPSVPAAGSVPSAAGVAAPQSTAQAQVAAQQDPVALSLTTAQPSVPMQEQQASVPVQQHIPHAQEAPPQLAQQEQLVDAAPATVPVVALVISAPDAKDAGAN
jgi:hypothetical protein